MLKKIRILELNQIFESATYIEKISENMIGIKLNRKQIAKVCKKEIESYKGYHFSYA